MGPTDQLYSLKIVCTDESNSLYILGAALVNPFTARSIGLELVSCSDSKHLNITPRATFKDFANRVQRIVYKGQQNPGVSKTLVDNFKSSFSNEGFLEEILHYMQTKDIAKISYLIEQIIIKSVPPAKPNVQLIVDLIPESEKDRTTMSADGQEEEGESGNESGGFADQAPDLGHSISDIPPGARVVQFKFMLSPVSGTMVKDLAIGSPVIVRLTQGDQATNDLIQTMNLRQEDGNIRPIPATITKISHSGHQSDIVIKINDSTYGKISEEENSVRIKTTIVESKTKSSKNVNVEKNIEALKNDNSFLIYIMAIVGLIALSVFAFVLFA
jgi:hypothetical protein